MRKHLLVSFGAVLVIGLSAEIASAQCAFSHPLKAKKFYTTFTQAFVACGNPGGNTPNATTEGGVPTCKPPETFAEQDGSPTNTWTWDTAHTSYGKLQIKPTSPPPCNTGPPSEQAQCHMLNPNGATTDAVMKVSFNYIHDDGTQMPSHGTGTVVVNLRATINDRTSGDMTIIDFPLNFQFQMAGGQASAATSFSALLNPDNKPGFPHCSNLEILSVDVLDQNGNTFATAGVFLP